MKSAQSRLFGILIAISTVIFSCQKELPPLPDNYSDLYPDAVIINTSIEIPCNDELEDNVFTTDKYCQGHVRFPVYQVSVNEGHREYQISTSHYWSNASVNIVIPDDPYYLRGSKEYTVYPGSSKSGSTKGLYDDYATFRFQYAPAFSIVPLFPIEESRIVVDFNDSTLVCSFCDMRVAPLSANVDDTVTLKGRIVVNLY